MKESNVILISKRGAMKYANQSVYWESSAKTADNVLVNVQRNYGNIWLKDVLAVVT